MAQRKMPASRGHEAMSYVLLIYYLSTKNNNINNKLLYLLLLTNAYLRVYCIIFRNYAKHMLKNCVVWNPDDDAVTTTYNYLLCTQIIVLYLNNIKLRFNTNSYVSM